MSKCKCNSCVMGFGVNGNGYQPCASKLKRPPTVGHAIKDEGSKEQPSILDHISAFVLGSAFGFVVGVAFVGIGKIL